MDDFGPASYGDAFADVYDRWYPDVTDVVACVDRLVDLAGSITADPTDDTGGATSARPASGAVLELGVGTGRLALPLAERGLAVTGVDASGAMLARLAAKPGADRLRLVRGDMSRLEASDLDRPPVDRPAFGPPFELGLVAYNTLFNLPDVDAQRACLAALASRVSPDGRVVIETFVPADPHDPNAARLGDDALTVSRVTADEVVLTASRHDESAQTVTGQHIQITDGGTRLRPWRIHYLRPDQLDHLAAGVGLVRVERWSDWAGRPFDDDSATAISIYRS